MEKPYLDLLRQLVELESPSRDIEQIREIAVFLAAEMGRRGFTVERRDAHGFGVHLLGRMAPTNGSERPLLVIGHMDTVHPVGTLDRLPFVIDEDRVHGPGVYDMKGGIAMVLRALDRLNEQGERPTGGLTFLISCDEEVGSSTSRDLIEKLARESRATLVIEPSAPGGAAKVGRKGMSEYRLRVQGRAAHAGIEPEAGASAIHELARQILAIVEHQDVSLGTTVNVGLLRGGTGVNVVAAEAVASIDFRFWTRVEAERVERAMRALRSVDEGCTLHLEGGVNRYPLEATVENMQLYEVAREVAAGIGMPLGKALTGGASDGNFTSAVGCPTLDGLGPDGGGAHTLHEHILRADIVPRIHLFSQLLAKL